MASGENQGTLLGKGEGGGGGTGGEPQTSESTVPEKLADDVIKPPLWQRVLYTVIPQLEKS